VAKAKMFRAKGCGLESKKVAAIRIAPPSSVSPEKDENLA
jgi:hypothetical protein